MERKAALPRETTETKISVTVSLDGIGSYEVNTGVGFFDHMLELFARHGLLDLDVRCDGTCTWTRTTVEDGDRAAAQILSALVAKKGIRRFGTAFVPMDEALCQVSLDVSGRPFRSQRPRRAGQAGALDTELLEEFLRALAVNAGLTLHVLVHYGTSAHHMVEGVFKALGRACREAFGMDPGTAGRVPSTKGTL